MKLKQLIYILSKYNLEDEVQLDLDHCKNPDDFKIEEEQTAMILRITQGNRGF
jgi:hypothetical protein